MASTPTVAANSDAARALRYTAQRVQWRESSLDRVRACGHHAAKDASIGVRHSVTADGRRSAGFSGLQTCGSVWSCAVCNAKVANERQEEVAKAVRAWESHGLVPGPMGPVRGSGTRYVAMVTLTMRHRVDHPLLWLWNALTDAWSKATSGREWMDMQAQFGGLYRTAAPFMIGADALGHVQPFKDRRIPWIRFVEATHGVNGWHLHIHALLFLDDARDLSADVRSAIGEDPDSVNAGRALLTQETLIGQSMFARWARALKRSGFDAPIRSRGGLDVKRFAPGAEEISRYMTKQTYEHAASARAKAELIAAGAQHRAGWELAGGAMKMPKNGNRTPFMILADVVKNGDEADLHLWHEWEQFSAGRRQVAWSMGLRDWVGLQSERTDEEIAADELDGETIGRFTDDDWARFRDHKAEILQAAEWLPLDWLRSAPARLWLGEYRRRREPAALQPVAFKKPPPRLGVKVG